MANLLYTAAKSDFLTGSLDLVANTVTIVLTDSSYTFDAGHTSRANVPNTAVVSVGNLAGKSVSNATFDASDIIFNTVVGNQITSIVIYHNTGNAEGDPTDQASSRLIGFIDTASGLPITPANVDITLSFSNLANKIFTI
tara:strand:+ start:197 stop:616 length:420 start_codon:yes stop_codon:yes gene_type:complete